MTTRPFSLRAYKAAMRALSPVAPAILHARARKGKEDAERLGERLGKTPLHRPEGPLVWLHGVSVGESLSLLPLIDRIRQERPDLHLLITSGTVTSANLLAKRLPPGVIHQFAPIDTPGAVDRFLRHWRPSVGLFAESELWPNLLAMARARDVRLALISARITEKTARGWARRKAAAKALLDSFELILPQDADTARRLTSLGAEVGPVFNLKYVGAPLPFDETQMKILKSATGSRQVVLAASTHPGEEMLVADAFAALPQTKPPPLLIIAPRHPDRGPAIAAELAAKGLRIARRGAGQSLTNTTRVYVADTLGEMGIFYRLATVAVIGGAFSPGIGGHNPLEPARLGAPIVSGPHAFNFRQVYDDLTNGVAGVLIADGREALATSLKTLLAQKPIATSMVRRAAAYADSQSQAFETGWGLIKALLP